MVALEMIVVRNADVLDANVGTEDVLMNIANGQYYALKATSQAIWKRLKEPVRVRDLCVDLADAYAMPLETVTTDTLAFLNYLAAEKMIESRAD
ncbi:MAG: PqqD family protein [Alphaproteobacteria bacterium HGW-Alphaproteobacteria-16]|nr:MAG: PqqD family protein [Alphaproteobacteria bacterium HGW-Alphaproteobacteria-16]